MKCLGVSPSCARRYYFCVFFARLARSGVSLRWAFGAHLHQATHVVTCFGPNSGKESHAKVPTPGGYLELVKGVCETAGIVHTTWEVSNGTLGDGEVITHILCTRAPPLHIHSLRACSLVDVRHRLALPQLLLPILYFLKIASFACSLLKRNKKA